MQAWCWQLLFSQLARAWVPAWLWRFDFSAGSCHRQQAADPAASVLSFEMA
jgi:hypothetical protein